jgi:CBS domain containing-hemolysin-like protein
VVDEFGGMSGILTLEDLVEELVGDIQDEFDAEETEVRPLESGEILVDGAVFLEEIENQLDLDFGDVEEETLGGFIFGKLAREVKPGDELEVGNVILRVEDVEGLRVTRVRVIPNS